jgi:shikimate dehydrogenase
VTEAGNIPISGRTRLCALIGSPVGHSLSPALHNAAFAATGLDLRYVAFDVPSGSVAAAIAAMRTLSLVGFSVTMPHKFEVARAVDRLTPQAEQLGSCNTIFRDPTDPGVLWGDSTDGDGFIGGLAGIGSGATIEGMRAVVIGAGGAGRAVVEALGRHGAADIVVVNRDRTKAESAARLAPTARVMELVLADDRSARLLSDSTAAVVSSADLVVNATSLGMRPGDPLPVPVEILQPGQLVADLIYHPFRTELLQAAEERGCSTMNGLPMLINQAAIQFRHWTGIDAPLEVMHRAAAHALAP